MCLFHLGFIRFLISVPQNMFFGGVVFIQIAVSFSCISFCDFAVESCSFGMHSGGTTGRRKEKTGRGEGWAGIRVCGLVTGCQ